MAYHPASNGLVEGINRKILDALHPVVNSLHDNWDDWLLNIAACINTAVSECTAKSPHYILYGANKRLLYGILASPPKPAYNIDSYAKQHMHIFTDIHTKILNRLQTSGAEMMALQHKRAVPVTIKV